MNYGDKLVDRLRLHRIGPKIRWESRKALSSIMAPRVALHDAPPFQLWGDSYDYFIHPYNMTWRNERAVEIAICKEFVAHQNGRGMEFGNVLAHYGAAGGAVVVDKYEQAPNVTNVDILDYETTRRFDYIVSISTLEHVGWDEKPRDAEKVWAAFEHLVSLLAPGGTLLLTAPTGHHPMLDEAILGGRWKPTRQATLVRSDCRRNLWCQTQDLEVRPYLASAGRGADALWVVEVVAPS